MWLRSGSQFQPINRRSGYKIVLQNALNAIARRDMLSDILVNIFNYIYI